MSSAMTETLGSALWALVALYGIYRLTQAVALFAPARVASVPAMEDPETVEIPADLVGMALLQSEPWAQDDMLKVCRQRYALLRDWNQVRVAMGVAVVA